MSNPSVPRRHADERAHRYLLAQELNNARLRDTWTPVIEGTTTAGAGTYTAQVGDYIKIFEHLVWIQATLTWTAHTGTGNIQLGGLPFTSSSAGSVAPLAVVDSSIALTANNIMKAYVTANTNVVTITQVPAGGGALAVVPMDTAGTIAVGGIYMID